MKILPTFISYLEEEDRISDLPDDILVSILSSMITGEDGEIDQVVRTSILSRRWGSLWNYALKKSLLSFTFDEFSSREDANYMKFVDRVNHILALPVYGDTIEEFNLTLTLLYLCQRHESDLHGWIGFALQKRVKQLSIELDLYYRRRFQFNNKVIGNHSMDMLVSLCLSDVDVTGEFLEYLLTICGSLEHLSVTESETLVNFTISGPSLKLKYLDIYYCYDLEHLYIRDVNLISFGYNDVSEDSTVVIENTPDLINARIESIKTVQKAEGILSGLPQLQTLALELRSGMAKRTAALEFPKLRHLVHLEWLLLRYDFSYAVCASLLVSCPSIRELKLVFSEDTNDEDREERLESPHECLKVVEIVGFTGCKLDIGVALYLVENTISLETILVDTRLPDGSSDEESKTRKRARASAKEHLGTRLLHTSTKLVLK